VVLKTWFKNWNQQFSLKKKVRTIQHWSQPTTLQHLRRCSCESLDCEKSNLFLIENFHQKMKFKTRNFLIQSAFTGFQSLEVRGEEKCKNHQILCTLCS
jgi:hypothetical protein